MAPGPIRALTQQDLDRAVRAVAGLLGTREVIVVGSQALLVQRDDIDRSLRASEEIDMFATTGRWLTENPGLEASEQIASVLGEGSGFHLAHGYFVDGVDERTATLPDDWRDRMVVREVAMDDGTSVTVLAPSPADIVAAKLHRGDPKDLEFASNCIRLGLARNAQVGRIIERIDAKDGLREQADRLLHRASLRKRAYVASKGPTRADPVEVMLRRLRDRTETER